jgi:alpha-beta hydrolase superfamily lysophospholipase
VAEADKIILPFTELQDSEDKLVEPSGAQTVCQKAGFKDKTTRIYQRLDHELFKEPERGRVFRDMGT